MFKKSTNKAFPSHQTIRKKFFKEKIHHLLSQGHRKKNTILLATLFLHDGLCILGDFIEFVSTVGGIMKPYKVSWKKYSHNERFIRNSLHYAHRRGYIKIWKKIGQIHCTMTSLGKDFLFSEFLRDIHPPKMDRWDGKWRIIFFDIPNILTLKRDLLRGTLKRFGCEKMQKSVFITPIQCFEEIDLLRKHLKVENFVRIIEVSSLEDERYWRKKFFLGKK